MRCPNCNTTNRAGARFCVNCGYQFAAICPQCNAPVEVGVQFCAQCGARLAAGGALLRDANGAIVAGTVLAERYQVRRLLGTGGFGAIYLADDLRLTGVQCAVKELFNTDYDTQHLFEQEASLLARLNHPQLVRVTDYFSAASGEIFLVMDFVAGDDLEEVLERAPGFLPEEQVVDWMMQACDALGYMHTWVDPRTGQLTPVIHRDIKPSNLKLHPDGKIMVIDLGIAKVKSAQGGTMRAARAYSPPYSPPEQYGAGTDERSDIYALGATMYQLLTKQLPLEAPYRAYQELTLPRQHNPHISAAVEQVILRAMAINPEQRFQTMAEMRAALEGAARPSRRFGNLREDEQATTAPPIITPQLVPAFGVNAVQLGELRTLTEHTKRVTGVAFNPDGAMLASASNDRTVRLWDVHSGQELRILKGHRYAVLSVAFSPDGAVLASGGQDHTVRLWDTRSGQQTRALKGHRKQVLGVAFSPDGAMLASASSDRTVKLWEVASGRELCTLIEHDLEASGVAFSGDGQTLASSSYDRTVILWDVANRRARRVLRGHTERVMNVVFSRTGAVLASADADKKVKLWDAHNGRELFTLSGHTSDAMSVAFSPDGAVLASGSCARWGRKGCVEGEIKLWEVKTGRELCTLKSHADYVMSVAFSPDGAILASGSGDGTVKLWSVVK